MPVKELSLLSALCAALSIVSAANNLPRISPDGYYATVNEEDSVEFKCLVPDDAYDLTWFINGISSYEIGEQNLADRGIRFTNTFVRKNGEKYAEIEIERNMENNSTKLQCYAHIIGKYVLESATVVFGVQGLLDPPIFLEIDYHNVTHQVLKWIPPFTLDLTAYVNDITGYFVRLVMESPPPRGPYNLFISIDHLTATSNQTWSVLGWFPKFFFPRYAFPVWLSVSAENPVGPGTPSPLLKYIPPDNCARLKDLVSELESDVIFNAGSYSPPSAEIILLHFITLIKANNCVAIDTAVVTLSSDHTRVHGDDTNEHDEEKIVLMPRLRKEKIIIDLEQHLLNPHTHYYVSVEFNPNIITSMHLSTHQVQRVRVKIDQEVYGLVVECVFAEGCFQNNTCTVLVEGENKKWMNTSTTPILFPDVPIGKYTVKVWDQQMVTGKGAVVRQVEVLPPADIMMTAIKNEDGRLRNLLIALVIVNSCFFLYLLYHHLNLDA